MDLSPLLETTAKQALTAVEAIRIYNGELKLEVGTVHVAFNINYYFSSKIIATSTPNCGDS